MFFESNHMPLAYHSYVPVCHGYASPMSSLCHLYELACHPYVTRIYLYVISPYITRMHSYVIGISIVCTCMPSICHLYVIECHPYITRMYSYLF